MPRKEAPVVEEERSAPDPDAPTSPSDFEVRAEKRAQKRKPSPSKKGAKKGLKTRRAEEKAKGRKLAKVADAFASFRHASQTLTEVRAVPTIFVQLDHATGVDGWPLERFALVHGKSGEGKTKFVIGLMLSFLMREHFVDYIDAEMTTPFKFVKTQMGSWADSPRFFAVRPSTYEEVIDRVRKFCNAIIQKKRTGEIDEETGGLIVVDSMRKLVPKDMLDEILKAAKEEAKEREEEEKSGKKRGITTGKDRRAQIQAKMNAAWMDEVIPLLARAGVSMVAIAREMEDPDAHPAMKKAGWGFKIGGGGALYYDSSLVVRVSRQGYVEEGGKEEAEDGKFEKKVVYGERHKITIHKTKIAGHEDKKTVAFFHASNGVLVPEGFDRARDLIEMSERLGCGVERSGSWFHFMGEKLAQGKDNAVVALSKDPETMDAIEKVLRATFSEAEAPQATEGGFE